MALFIISLSWFLDALYCGYAFALAIDPVRPPAQRTLLLAGPLLMLGCTQLFLLDQHFFSDLEANLVISIVELALILASLAVGWNAPGKVGASFRRIGVMALGMSLLGFCWGPGCFFLPLLFFPSASELAYHFGFEALFSTIILGTCLLARRRMRFQESTEIPAAQTPRAKKRPGWLLILAVPGLIAMIYLSDGIQTMIVLHKRDHSMKVFQVEMALAEMITHEDKMREEEGNPSIYPADLNIRNARDYFAYLRANNYLEYPSFSDMDISEFDIGNVSRNDPDHTIIVRSHRPQSDIHMMIYQIGGVPNYPQEYILFRKDGQEQLHRLDAQSSPFGTEPPRTPAYLPAD